MKNVLRFTVLFALAFVAAAPTTSRDWPPPTCWPCPPAAAAR
jgi:hypothetical protein